MKWDGRRERNKVSRRQRKFCSTSTITVGRVSCCLRVVSLSSVFGRGELVLSRVFFECMHWFATPVTVYSPVLDVDFIPRMLQ